MTIQFHIPDFFALTPFEGWKGFHKTFVREERASTEWMLSHGIFATHKYDRVYASEAELLACIAYNNPLTTKEELRTIGDYLMILFTIDEITDDQDVKEAAQTRETFIKALTGNSGEDDSPITRFTKEFLKRLSKNSDAFRKRFIEHCICYMEATANEVTLRGEEGLTMSIEEYFPHRRNNGGIRACFDLIELSLGIELPAEVFEDPDFLRVHYAADDMICWSNDVYSYPMEYARGIEASNAVTIIMKEKGLSLQDAVNEAAISYKEFGDTVNTYRHKIRSYGPKTDADIQNYIDGMQQWVWGNLEWSFRMKRYFGKNFEEVRRTGIVELAEHGSVL